MKLIIGLGNPGKEYENTRHNVGFLAVDQVAAHYGVNIKQKKFKALAGEVFIKGQKVVLIKPQTYMNLSGSAVADYVRYYDVDLEDIVVICDDLDIGIGRIRLREKGTSGGQKGIESIIAHLGSKHFMRLKIGIGNNKLIDTKDYVLGKKDDGVAVAKAAQCVIDYLEGANVKDLMNKYHPKEDHNDHS